MSPAAAASAASRIPATVTSGSRSWAADLFLNGDFTHHPGSTITGEGSIDFNQGTHILPVGIGLPTGLIDIGTDVTFNDALPSMTPVIIGDNATFNVDQTISELTHSAGAIIGDTDVTITGNYTWTDGDHQGPGSTITEGGFTASTTTSRSLLDRRTLEIMDTGLWIGNSSSDFTNTFYRVREAPSPKGGSRRPRRHRDHCSTAARLRSWTPSTPASSPSAPT